MTKPDPHAESRAEIESKIVFLERTVDDLSDVIVAQGRSIELLEGRLAKIEGRAKDAHDEEPGPANLLEERPPHY